MDLLSKDAPRENMTGCRRAAAAAAGGAVPNLLLKICKWNPHNCASGVRCQFNGAQQCLKHLSILQRPLAAPTRMQDKLLCMLRPLSRRQHPLKMKKKKRELHQVEMRRQRTWRLKRMNATPVCRISDTRGLCESPNPCQGSLSQSSAYDMGTQTQAGQVEHAPAGKG